MGLNGSTLKATSSRDLWSTVFLGFLSLQAVARPQSNRPVYRSEFRYVVLSDEVADLTGARDLTRSVKVLMDDKAFSEENLTKLFGLLLKRYPEPDWMYVWVVTSLEQVATPEEDDRQKYMLSHSNNHPEYDLYNHAVLIRQGEDEFFRYTMNAPRTEMKTVVLKGRDPATSKCVQ